MWPIISLILLALAAPTSARYDRVWSSTSEGSATVNSNGVGGASIATSSSNPLTSSMLDAAGSAASATSTAGGSTPIPSSSSIPSSSTVTGNSTSSSSNGVNVPASCFKPHGVPVGWLPDDVDITTIQNKVKPNTTPCTYGQYPHIVSDTDYGDDVMSASASIASKSGALFTISLQPLIPFNQVSASKVAASMNNVLSKGPSVVWLRFAHEMNWYISTNSKKTAGPTYYGSTDEFKKLWRDIANAVDRSRVKMFWSPNEAVYPDTITSIGTDWWPGAEFVDIVGMDNYPQEEQTFEDAFGEFYDLYAKPYGLPFALGETGWLNGGTDEQKRYWLGQVSGAETLRRCPNYLGFAWFEYDKPEEGNFRVVMGGSNIAADVLS